MVADVWPAKLHDEYKYRQKNLHGKFARLTLPCTCSFLLLEEKASCWLLKVPTAEAFTSVCDVDRVVLGAIITVYLKMVLFSKVRGFFRGVNGGLFPGTNPEIFNPELDTLSDLK